MHIAYYVNNNYKQYDFFKHRRLIILKYLLFIFYSFKYITLYFLNVYLCIIILKKHACYQA